MSYADGRFWISFNGEIYNFRELSVELQALGHHFLSDSDTEVLLAAIAQWGIDAALKRLVGMFALAVWDQRERVLHLARDRMGEKPLYLGTVDNHLFFASELRAFRAIPGFNARINPLAVAGYLRDGCVPGLLSMYEGVYKLPPASVVTVRVNGGQRLSPQWAATNADTSGAELRYRPYWSCVDAALAGRSCLIRDEHEATEHVERILSDAIRMQMHSDVPSGAFLSGGIDSTTVVALMQKLASQPIHTFTVAFDDPRFDE
jgi:asparagine synthase (glutamine-hydrolysing)